MHKGIVCVVLLTWATATWGQSARQGKAETLARWHFVGTRELSNKKDLQTLREIIELKESAELKRVGVEGFAAHIAGRFTKSPDTNANARVAALIKPLLPDLIESESSFELTARGADDADWALAVKLPAERQGVWNQNLADLANAAQMNVAKAEKGDSWSATRDHYRMKFSPGKEWLLIEGGFGPGETKGRKLAKGAGKEILTAEINSPAIARIWSAERFAHAPKLSLSVVPRKNVLRSEMLIDYPQSLNITPEPWKIPTDLIFDPLIGFTAVQGFAGTLAQNPQFQQLGAEKTPNQAFLWSQSTLAFTVFAAADVGNPSMVISNIISHVLPSVNNRGGNILVLTNRPALVWRGFPVVSPFVEAGADGRSPYLVGGLFPVSTEHAKPAPPELFAQLKKKNLVYYDWEITQERLKQWRPIWQFAQIFQGKLFPPSASDRWIEAITPKLENTITEATLENPSRLKLVRQSQSGLSALELVLLAHAVDPYDVAERPAVKPGQAPRKKNTPPKR